MTFWDYLDRAGERMSTRESRIIPHDFRGWVALGLFIQASGLFLLMAEQKDLLDSQAFTTLATAIIVTGWIGGVAAFAYSAGKQQGEASALAKQALDLASASQPGGDTNSDQAKGAQQAADAAQHEADDLAAKRPDAPEGEG